MRISRRSHRGNRPRSKVRNLRDRSSLGTAGPVASGTDREYQGRYRTSSCGRSATGRRDARTTTGPMDFGPVPAGLRPIEGMMVRSRIAAGIAIGLLTVVVGWIAWLLVGRWQVRDGLLWARRRMDAKQYPVARDRLAWLSIWWPRQEDVAYLLGVCEAELGHPEAALAAWGRVPSGSPRAPERALAEGRILVRALGRLADAETCYRAAARGTSPTAIEARWALAELLLWEGRLDGDAPAAPRDRPSRAAPRPDRCAPRTLAARLGDRRSRGSPADPRPGRADRARRRPGLAGTGVPRHPLRPLHRGARLAGPMPGPPSRRSPPARAAPPVGAGGR